MSKSFKALGLAVGALALTHLPASAQTKVTNEGISPTEIVIGTHQDLSGPIKVWGVPVSNGMKMAVEEINAAGGINGRKLRMILEDNGYDPKKAVLATQKMIERDKVFAMVGPMGSATVLAAQDILFDAGVLQLFPLTAAEFTFKFDPSKPQERLKFNNLSALCREHPRRAQIHDGSQEFQEALPDASGRRVRQKRAARFQRAACGDESNAGFRHQLQARRFRFQCPDRQDEIRRLRSWSCSAPLSAKPSARWARPGSSDGT